MMTEPTKRIVVRGKPLDPRIADWVLATVARIEFDAAAAELATCIEHKCKVNPKELGVRGQLQCFLEDHSHRFMASWRTYFGVWAGALGNVSEAPMMPPIEMTMKPVADAPCLLSVGETGIVKTITVDDWSIDFTLPALTRDGAEQARVTLTELATRLGYSDKSKLKQLAERHASELAEFGGSATVAVPCQAGARGMTTIQEPTYNPDQAAYLALSSETEQGRACRVRILKAYKTLVALFERVIELPKVAAPIDYQALAQVVGMAVAAAMTPIVAQMRPGRRRPVEPSPAQTVIPQIQAQTQEQKPVQPRRDPFGNARLAAIPAPSSVKDPAIMAVLRNMIDVYGQASQCFDEGYNLVYDAILRDPELGPDFKKREHGTRIQYIGSHNKIYQRKVLELAYRVLVLPNLREA